MSRFVAATTPFGQLPIGADGGHDPQAAFDAGKEVFRRTLALHRRVASCNAHKSHPALRAAMASGLLSNPEIMTAGSCSAALRKCAIGSLRYIEQDNASKESETPLATNCDPVVRFGMWAFANRSLLHGVRSVKVMGVHSSGVGILLGALALAPCALEEISGGLLAPAEELPDEVAKALMGADPVQQLALEHKFGAPVFLWNTTDQGRIVQLPGSAPDCGPVFEGGADELCSDFQQLQRGAAAHAIRVLPGLIHAKADTLRRVSSGIVRSAQSDEHAALQDMYVATPLAFHCQGIAQAHLAMPLQLGGPLKGSTLLAVANRRSLKSVSLCIECDMDTLHESPDFSIQPLTAALDSGCEQIDVRAALNATGQSSTRGEPNVPEPGSPLSPLTWLSGLETLHVEIDVYVETGDGEKFAQGAALEHAAVQCVAQCIRDNAATLTDVQVQLRDCCVEVYGGEGGILAALSTCERLRRLSLHLQPLAFDNHDVVSINKDVTEGTTDLNAAQLAELRSSWVMPPAQREAASAAGATYLRTTLQNNAASLQDLRIDVLDANACVAFLQAAPALQGVKQLEVAAGGLLGTVEYALDVEKAHMHGDTLNGATYETVQLRDPTVGTLTDTDVPSLALLPPPPALVLTAQVSTLVAMQEHMLRSCAAWMAVLHGVSCMSGLQRAKLRPVSLWEERTHFWPEAADKPCSALASLELTALRTSAAAGNLHIVSVFADDLVVPAVVDVLRELTAAGAQCIEELRLESHGRGYDKDEAAATAYMDVAAVNACVCQLRRLKRLQVRQTLHTEHVPAAGASLLHGVSFYGDSCELQVEGLMTAADTVALATLFSSQAPGVRFREVVLCTGRAYEQEVQPSAALFERLWAAMGAAPCLRRVEDVSLDLPPSAFGCPSALPALLGWRQLRDVSLKPDAGSMTYLECDGEAELLGDVDDRQHQRYVAALSCVQRSLRAMREAGTLEGAVGGVFGDAAYTAPSASSNNATMSKHMQALVAAGTVGAPPNCEVCPFALLVQLLEEPVTAEDAAAYSDDRRAVAQDMLWVARQALQAGAVPPEASCPVDEAAACEARREAAAAAAAAFMQQQEGILRTDDMSDPALHRALNELLAHAVNVLCAALPGEVLHFAASRHWEQLAALRVTVPLVQRQELLQWARAISPSVGAGGVQTSLAGYHCDWRGGQSSVDAMGYGAAVAFPAPNVHVMLPQGHATPVRDAADALDVHAEHVAWFRIVGPLAGWQREALVQQGVVCSEGNNYGAAQSLEKMMHDGSFMDTPVYNCFGSDFDHSPLVDCEPLGAEGSVDGAWDDEDEDDDSDEDSDGKSDDDSEGKWE